ncbi:MAG: 50S ribosomal protein L10 [Candidatus Verstraetearchaeota archaeon]|jgi:large subunit ribosomal protein L10|nr:50S ribosomal protein L10 [Candidatus Culexarchaeum yellowstonense]MCS7366515.1 50S ribosomal protein L10 [Candidatus Culexarchaeum yellowstonense]NHV11650.1 50S ribosomal protein L10 [Candidatus Verstraetearchaeota archaeon]
MLKTIEKKIPKKVKKQKVLEELMELMKSNEIIAIASLKGLRARQLQEIRKILRDNGIHLKITKNTLFRKAIEECSKDLKNIESLEKYLSEQNAFIFSNGNPFELALILEKNKVYMEAKAGDIAQNDIVVPTGNTGMTPGPIISKFNALKIPVKIEEGSIWITKDTVVAKKGDIISPDLADILKRLNIKPIEVKMRIKALYFNGRILGEEELKLNIEEYRQMIKDAVRNAYIIAIDVALPIPEVMVQIITKAARIAKKVAAEVAAPEPGIIKETLAIANNRALMLAMKLMQINPELKIEGITMPAAASAAPSAEAKPKEEKKKEEKKEKEEEEVAEGLASLFG